MRKNALTLKCLLGVITVALTVLAASNSALSQSITSGQKVKLKGLITARAGENMTIRTANNENVTVILGENTSVEMKKGALGIRKKKLLVTSLIPGLKVEVNGVGTDNGQVEAKSVSFNGDDLQTAQQIQAGLDPTQQELKATEQQVDANKQGIDANKQAIQANQQQIQANQQRIAKVSSDEAALNRRFSELSDYDVKDTVTVYFATNSAALSEKSKQDLLRLATNAASLAGYLIQVTGYASSTGSASLNQKLSSERSTAVVDYLAQTGKVELRHILAPMAMGATHPAATNETAEGRAQNRRVEVKVLINKGISGK
jgi:OmpA-OmpF porin, OOP family